MAAVSPALAQTAVDPSVTACKSTGLTEIKQTAPDATDLVDNESLAINKADTKVEDVPVKTVILGEAYFSRSGKTGKSDRFVCLPGGQRQSPADLLYSAVNHNVALKI